MIIGVPEESFDGERRVALVPDVVHTLVDKGLDVLIQTGAGVAAGFGDELYQNRGAEIVSAQALFERADVILQVRTYGANPAGAAELERLRPNQTVIGFTDALDRSDRLAPLAATGVNLLSMELMPRITRAQSMDALSSMATIAGYKAVLMAADRFPRIFPLLMTAAGTLAPARVLVLGAGVAGLQAIATAKRLGARVSAFDVRAAVKEQINSLGADFVELEIDAGDSEDAGGYATVQDEAFYERQRAALAEVIAGIDIVITTAAIPGRAAPLLVTEAAVDGMAAGSVIIDLAAERGGNCALTQPGQDIQVDGVTICGPLNLASTIPAHASQMYAHNIATFLQHLLDDEGQLSLDLEDEITAGTLVAREGAIVHERTLQAQGLAPESTPDSTN
ncbi:MAG: Re/Si-specific NAD(P)(+) transhydrogenase subunit alpha [Gemmatimonadetes bacterium]|jgi:H+-translocating NAD(P) transhydrogenase subunit alpha|nr:Re/Si-specific NAD(P)(+) transhydrogenase subunit alpha [Gemmatimonadota bacterium]MBT6149081.1 Re/Si-specific NAD(P)(+) transhydrogenase subunit alpha [Gemmatimonadota bacterium]MBT7863473.1 Re/Si-specific NAD(P)(+) transhydrogenase subunit alpha [Gemmatimonadota bacterium]